LGTIFAFCFQKLVFKEKQKNRFIVFSKLKTCLVNSKQEQAFHGPINKVMNELLQKKS